MSYIPSSTDEQVAALEQLTKQTGSVEEDAEGGQRRTHAQKRFYESSLCTEARTQLQSLVDSPDYSTDPSRLSDDTVSFVERHLHHLSIYPQTNLTGYISNLKLMTSTRRSRADR